MAKKNTQIPQKVRIQVWTEAAGRCQFKNCNKPLWYNELTLSQTNFSEMAHIIGASEEGPRGGSESNMSAKDPDNIMLVCARCHAEIDNSITRGDYSVPRLKSMKKEHTERVRMLLDVPGKKTRPLTFTTQIGGQSVTFSPRAILKAILPDYPDKTVEDWFKINIDPFDRKNSTSWKAAKDLIDANFESINRACAGGYVPHISVFGIAPQPLLMYLGSLLGDKVSSQIFEPRRTPDQDLAWAWDDETGAPTIFEQQVIRSGNSKKAVLLFALSDYLNLDKYKDMTSGDPSVFKLTIESPVQGFLTRKSDKTMFVKSARSLLNKIQNEVGKDCIIHVLPAMPASLAIEFGRLIQPTKDPKIYVYEYIDGKPEKVIRLGNGDE